ncbi:MAG: hypothetical protein KDB94_07020, partial [Acidobacteria bacterium]|nr:hypothetical protein [Acidobacteriota bacterium]
LRVRIGNARDIPGIMSISQLPAAEPVELAIRNFDEDTGELSWPALPSSMTMPVPDDGELLVNLAPRRADFNFEETGSILSIRNGAGARRLIAVSAKTVFAPPGFAQVRARAGRAVPQAATTTSPLAGLWVGEISVRKVSQAQTGSLVPTPTGSDFVFRTLVHVDGSGTPRLLKEVIQLWQDGTQIPDPEHPGFFLIDEPGYYVLVTDDSLISSFSAPALRDGQPFGYRMSTAAYDFEPQTILMNGTFGTTGTLTVTLTLDSEAPTNPFRHKFHPDHNNLDDRYISFREEAYAVTRVLEFDFSPTDPFERSLPSYGESEIGGVYRETISGLHRNDIAVEGLFLMRRVSTRPFLNQ